jgi:hypothetical protein
MSGCLLFLLAIANMFKSLPFTLKITNKINNPRKISFTSLFIKFKEKLNFITITDVTLKDGLIYCSYNLTIALRIHHLPIIDNYKLPKEIMGSFALKYLSTPEREFIFACNACNDTLTFSKNNPYHEIIKLSTGKEITIMIYNTNSPNNMREFKINDLSKFTGLYRKYRTSTEVEKIITSIFKKDKHV